MDMDEASGISWCNLKSSPQLIKAQISHILKDHREMQMRQACKQPDEDFGGTP